jgi:glycosyltransferase involved in cell wall biosynthesis
MRIAIAGTRGIPARYGGFETFAEELGQNLAARGHDVTVYCRQRHSQPTYIGCKLVYLPTIRHKYFDTIAHTALSILHAAFQRYDVILCCNAANAVFCWLPRILGTPVALNVDGLERKRKKWNALARLWYLLSERLATFLPTHAVSDAAAIQAYYKTRYKTDTTFIPYGAEIGPLKDDAHVRALGLTPQNYFLYVSRLEPENNALLVRQAFEQIDAPLQLALIGDAPYASEYIAKVRDTQDPRILLPGAIYGDGYKQLGSHCFAYIHATEVGGTHPALIEAMGRGALVLYLSTVENEEVAGGCGLPFTHENLPDVLRRATAMPEAERKKLQQAALEKTQATYSWQAVTSQYEALFEKLLKR